MPRSTSGSSEPARDWFDEQLEAYKWRNGERSKPDYQLEYDNVLGAEVQNARSRYLETMAEHEKQQRFGRNAI